VSRGTTEFDVTGGTAALRYQTKPVGYNSQSPTTGSGGTVAYDNVNCRLVTSSIYTMAQLSPVANSNQNWAWSGSANINGQSPVTFSQPSTTTNVGTWYNTITQATPFQLKTSGDTAIAYVQDYTNNKAYQVVYMANGGGGGAMNIQRLA